MKAGIFPPKLVASISGGVDSTALLLALTDLRRDGLVLVAGHVNHHLRGADSDADERFVRELCASLDVPLEVADGTLDPARIRAVGVEAAAREVRYERLSAIRTATGSDLVATAHQKDDQAETVLMRLLSGGGIASLRGIHPIREDGFVRPLLEVTRQEIESFLQERGVTPRIDQSNSDERFLRNRIRSLVRDLEAVDALASLSAQARQIWPLLERAIDEAERECVFSGADSTLFKDWPSDPWLRQALLHRHIRRLDPDARDVGSTDLERLASSVGGVRRITVTRQLELLSTADGVLLRRLPQAPVAFEYPLTELTPAVIPELDLALHVAPADGRRGDQTIQLPPGALPSFVVRNRRPGDRFRPLGLGGTKKLKDFLIDRKIPAEVRDRLPLLLWNDEIVWIAGVEVSDRFKVTTAPGDRYDVWLEGRRADDRDHFRDQRRADRDAHR